MNKIIDFFLINKLIYVDIKISLEQNRKQEEEEENFQMEPWRKYNTTSGSG